MHLGFRFGIHLDLGGCLRRRCATLLRSLLFLSRRSVLPSEAARKGESTDADEQQRRSKKRDDAALDLRGKTGSRT